jgi:uncharacterized damage-inducible protein DinB
MDMLDRLLGHDRWTTRHLLMRCRELTPAQWAQPFDLGHGTLPETFAHLIGNIETWTDLMLGRPMGQNRGDGTGVEELLQRLDTAADDFAGLARRIRDEGRLDELWTDILDDPPRQKSYGGAVGHVLTHNMAHRAEILHMLARLGLPDLIEGDLLGWEAQVRAANVQRWQSFTPGQTAQIQRAYQFQYADPIVLQAGDVVGVEDRPSEWPGWLWCTHPAGRTGWVPADYLERSGPQARARRDYSARELSVAAGETIALVDYANEWYWVTNSAGAAGWIPADRL